MSMSIKDYSKNCKCCNGTGIQMNREGINIKCPACGGTGNWNNPAVTWEARPNSGGLQNLNESS